MKTPTWQEVLQQAVTDPEELLHVLDLDMSLLEKAKTAAKLFPLKVPRGFIDRMQKGNAEDPLLLQILPLVSEIEEIAGYTQDALAEAEANPLPGLLHKYQSRVLVTLVGACAVNCRFCFRRHFPYEDNNPGKVGWEKIFEYVRNDPSISEVILSGGDPLLASDHVLNTFEAQLATIPHIKRLRIHTRVPIVLPERINASFLNWVQNSSLRPIIVLHCNHPQELSAQVKTALSSLRAQKIILLNQSVLLKNVNDNVDTLVELSEKLMDCGVIPYYLNVLDKVQGTAHFDLGLDEAQKLHAELTKRLSGYLVPRLVQEMPGMTSKVNVSDLFTV